MLPRWWETLATRRHPGKPGRARPEADRSPGRLGIRSVVLRPVRLMGWVCCCWPPSRKWTAP